LLFTLLTLLGVIASTAVKQNQNCTAITVPNADSLSDLFRKVTHQAKIEPRNVSVIEAHGTGTAVGDPAEYESLRRVFGGPQRSTTLFLGSVKGLIGHTECGSGIVALIKMLLMIHQGAIPPQASFDTINPALNASAADKIEIVTELKPWDAPFKAALINNYGASGSNASMLITEGPNHGGHMEIKPAILSAVKKHPFWFSGFDDQSLAAYANKFIQFLRSHIVSTQNISLSNLSFNNSRQSNRSLNRALIFSCKTIHELEEKLLAFASGYDTVSSTPRPAQRPVVLCFGGQISRLIGLDREVFDSVKILRNHLDQCQAVCQSMGMTGIYPEIFQRMPVEDPVRLQTMLFAVQWSCAKTWIECGIQISAVVGHSFGELTALCISGVLSLEDTVRMIAGRARIIRDYWGSDRGSMMAVEANIEDVEKLLAESSEACPEERAVTIACFNGPRSFTLAGSTKAIEAVSETLNKNTVFSSTMRTKKLNVSNAFHSTRFLGDQLFRA
jgi:acyl transferase domain-containing protein